MEAMILCVVIGLIIAIMLVGVGICIGENGSNESEEVEIDEEADVLAAQLRGIEATIRMSPAEHSILLKAVAYIEKKGLEECAN